MFDRKIRFILKPALLASAITAMALSATLVLAQPRADENSPSTPTPRLAEGTVDFGGNGVWNLPWITDFAVRMPGYEVGDLPPMLPWTQAMWEYNKFLLDMTDDFGTPFFDKTAGL